MLLPPLWMLLELYRNILSGIQWSLKNQKDSTRFSLSRSHIILVEQRNAKAWKRMSKVEIFVCSLWPFYKCISLINRHDGCNRHNVLTKKNYLNPKGHILVEYKVKGYVKHIRYRSHITSIQQKNSVTRKKKPPTAVISGTRSMLTKFGSIQKSA